jgi:hypothetical protein
MVLSEALSANHDVQPVPDKALLDFLADFEQGRLAAAQQTIATARVPQGLPRRRNVRTRDWALSSTER